VFETPVMTFPIKKSLFIDRAAALYIGETRIIVGNIEGDQCAAPPDWRIEYTLARNAILISEGVGMKDKL